MKRTPLAIVGRGCVLPGARTPQALADLVFDGVDMVRPQPTPGRFRLPEAMIAGAGPDRAVSLAGGYVDDPSAPDPLVRWLAEASAAALAEAGVEPRSHGGRGDARLRRTAAVFGNLGFPSEGMARFGEDVALAPTGIRVPDADPGEASSFGGAARQLRETLGLGGACHALDAACASSLYAIQLAMDTLCAGRADLVLAGAVQRSDSLFLHVGFTALGALSPSGRSRPFHADADGLVPAEGAAMLALCRLEDALRDGRRIHGIIRGVGTSNDGRARSLLAPSSEGQARAIRAAWAEAGVDARDVGLVECHATGTPTGDRTELATLRGVYGDSPLPAIGSLKSQFGHLVTTAGAAGILKVLAGFERETMPPTLHTDAPIPETTGFTLLDRPRAWNPTSGGTRVAGVSAFGFGGNNAHLVLESPPPARKARRARTEPAPVDADPPALCIVAVGGQLGDAPAHPTTPPRSATRVALSLHGLRFPPNDLRMALPQQAMVLAACSETLGACGWTPDRARTGVYVAMECDPRITAWGLRWRLPTHLDAAPTPAQRDAAAPALRAEHVLGTMPNIPANRVNVQHDLGGPGFTIAAEDASAAHAIVAATDALRAGRVDLALVAGVHVGGDPRDDAARSARGLAPIHEDTCIALALVRATDAAAHALPVLARIDRVLWALEEDAVSHEDVAGPATGLLRLLRAMGTPGVLETNLTGLRVSGTIVSVPIPGHPTKGTAEGTLALPVHPDRSTRAMLHPMPAAPVLPPVASRMPMGHGTMQRRAPQRSDRSSDAGPTAAATHAGTVPLTDARNGQMDAVLERITVRDAAVARAHATWLTTMQARHHAFLTSTAALLPTTTVFAPAAAPEPIQVSVVSHPPPLPAPTPTPVPMRSSAATAVEEGSATRRPGPNLDRHALEHMSRGPVSRAFGEAFAPQDAYARVVRMPAPPLLLCDRVLGISGPPLVLGRGSTWTETDVGSPAHRMPGTPEGTPAWYLYDGHMRGGVFIEAGQADLLIASWQGMDVLHNRGERVYRLLGCDLTYRGPLPATGETLRYDIHLDAHAKLGDVRMFFFHYDCRVDGAVRLDVRNGQAGFFTDAELASSGGVLWDATTAEVTLPTRHDAAPCTPPPRLTRDDLQAFAARDLVRAFGDAYARSASHTRSPSVPGGTQMLLDDVEAIDPTGGPWGRGYLRARLAIAPDDWFFDGHFHGDPCMPGTLMFDGCLHAMAVYMAATGLTLHADGWRFEPVKDETFHLRCRGQVTPASRQLVYEVFVQQLVAGDPARGVRPRVTAQILCTVDGLKCFHADPLALELVPDWPDLPAAPEAAPDILSAALGRPSHAFGAMYRGFDDGRAVPRLPAPPYLCIDEVVHVTEGSRGSLKAGAEVRTRVSVPTDAWCAADGAQDGLPWSWLLETALQPCGWLASHVGCVTAAEGTVLFRNLDGNGILHRVPQPGMLDVRANLTRLSRSAGMILVQFTVEVTQAEEAVYTLETGFGFFPPEAFAQQAGVGSTPEQRAGIALRGEELDLRGCRELRGVPLSTGRLGLLDRVVFHARDGGARSLGTIHAEMRVDPAAWFFKAHFFQDPVQPGSLGLEAIAGLARVAMALDGAGERWDGAIVQSPAPGGPHAWRYRGQVVPENRTVHVDLDVMDRTEDSSGETWTVDGAVWVDGTRIYTCSALRVRIEGTRRRAVPPEIAPAVVAAPEPLASAPQVVPWQALPIRAGERELTAVLARASSLETTEPTAHAGDDAPTASNVAGGTAMPDAAAPAWPFGTSLHTNAGDGLDAARLIERLGCDPQHLVIDGNRAWSARRPLRCVPTDLSVSTPRVEIGSVLDWWRARLGTDDPWHEGLMHALLRAFVADVVIHDPDALARVRGRPVLMLANHQNYLEGALFTAIASPILGVPLRAVAKTAHRERWLGTLTRLATNYPGARYVDRVAWFDPSDGASLPGIARRVSDRPLLVHVEGTRQTEPGQRVEKLSSTWIDLAVEHGLPIVPVAFRGGATGAGTRHEVPPCPQVYHMGAPIQPDVLAAMPYADRRRAVAQAIDGLGTPESLAEGAVVDPGSAIAAAIRTWAPELARRAERPPRGPLSNWFALLATLTRGETR